MTVLTFPHSAADDAPEHEHVPAMMRLRAEWHGGMRAAYRLLGEQIRWPGQFPEVRAPGRHRPLAVAAFTFDAFMQATATRPTLRTPEVAYASGFMAAWADHPQAEQCVNCDLPFVPGIEDGHSRCTDHGWTCSEVCRVETCRVPSCRDED